jgi:hypothetical protein
MESAVLTSPVVFRVIVHQVRVLYFCIAFAAHNWTVHAITSESLEKFFVVLQLVLPLAAHASILRCSLVLQCLEVVLYV